MAEAAAGDEYRRFHLTSLGEDEDGELYIVQINAASCKRSFRKGFGGFRCDFRTDFSVFRPEQAMVHNERSDWGDQNQTFGVAGDIPTLIL